MSRATPNHTTPASPSEKGTTPKDNSLYPNPTITRCPPYQKTIVLPRGNMENDVENSK